MKGHQEALNVQRTISIHRGGEVSPLNDPKKRGSHKTFKTWMYFIGWFFDFQISVPLLSHFIGWAGKNFRVFFSWVALKFFFCDLTAYPPRKGNFWEMICLFPKVGYVGSLGRERIPVQTQWRKASNCRASELSSLLWWLASGIYANFWRFPENLRFLGVLVQHFDWWQVIQNWPSGYIYTGRVRVVQKRQNQFDRLQNMSGTCGWFFGEPGAVKNPSKKTCGWL